MKITIKNLQKKLPVRPDSVKKLVLRILEGEKIKGSGFINICIADDSLIRKFNKKFLKDNSSTDVLAFNLSGGESGRILLGDIMISADTAINNARRFRTLPRYELMLYIAHGVLHILGYDDHDQRQRKRMRKKEIEYVDR